jgi:hypothetical protein
MALVGCMGRGLKGCFSEFPARRATLVVQCSSDHTSESG